MYHPLLLAYVHRQNRQNIPPGQPYTTRAARKEFRATSIKSEQTVRLGIPTAMDTALEVSTELWQNPRTQS